MAGQKGRSGRKSKADPNAALPDMGATEDTIRNYLAAICIYVKDGRIDPRMGDTLVRAAMAALTAVRIKQKSREVDQIEEWLKRAEELYAEGTAHEVAQRQHLINDQSPPETRKITKAVRSR